MTKPKKIYLVAQYFARPKNKKMTSIPGYMKDPANIAWDEQVNITVGLKNRDKQAKIVLNISDQVVEQNGFVNGRSFMELFEYFYTASPQDIGNALRQVGITIGEKNASTTGNVPEDQGTAVQGEAKESERSESPASTDPIGTSEGSTVN